MEKQRSFSCKSTKFLVLCLTFSFSLALLSSLFCWAMQTSPLHYQQTYVLLNASSLSLSLNPLSLQSLTGPFADQSANPRKRAFLSNTHVQKANISSGFVGNNSLLVVSVDGSGANVSTVEGDESANPVEGAYLSKTHVQETDNSFGFVGDNSLVVVSVDGSGANVSSVEGNESTNEAANLVKRAYLSKTHVQETDISSGFVGNSSVEVSVNSKDEKFTDDRVKVSNFESAHLGKPQYLSGFVKSSNLEEKFGKNLRRKVKRRPNLTAVGKVVDEEIEKKRGKSCDVSKGRWVVDENYPLYTNMSCPFIDEGFDCQGNGRLDKGYMKWRWQPHHCDLPRFNATNMLELIRGKRLVFAGDSINRNQWESLLCLLLSAVKDPSKVYEIRHRRITKNRGSYSFRFVDYQCTVEFYVTHFLVRESKAKIGKKRKGTLRIDSIDRESRKWRGADILVFNTGNWWSHYKTKAGKNYYQEGEVVYPHLDAMAAYRKALLTWASWVDRHVNPHKTIVFFRSTAPAHFRGGQWNTGGHCREARTPLKKMYKENSSKDLIAQEVIRKMKTSVTFLNITGLSSYRIDGHPSKYGRNPGLRDLSGEDCSHWCLPGVPDAWNELLYHQLLLKQQNVYSS